MFTAYFDASGTPNEPFVVVAGYIANLYQWKAFERIWAGVHSEFGVKLPFHMSDFMAATQDPDRYAAQRNAREDYVAIARNRDAAGKFFGRLCVAEQTMATWGVSCIVDMQIYNGVSSLLDLRTVIPPYALAAITCMTNIRVWEQQFGIYEPVECIFEKGDLEQDKFTALLRKETGESPIYKDKKDFLGLQAADHYAWEQGYYLRRQRTGEHLPVRESFKFLLNMIPRIHREVSQAGLIELCHRKGINPRTGVSQPGR